jgi:hypothetical protein
MELTCDSLALISAQVKSESRRLNRQETWRIDHVLNRVLRSTSFIDLSLPSSCGPNVSPSHDPERHDEFLFQCLSVFLKVPQAW